MDQPGSRHRTDERRPLIIERPDLQTRGQRVAFGAITIAFWALWSYLWLPFASLVAWWFGIAAFLREVSPVSDASGLLGLLGWYAIVISVLTGTLLGWAAFNWWRFFGVEKRAPVAAVQVDVLAPLTDVGAETLAKRWQSRVLVVLHTQGGRIIGLRERDPNARDEAFVLPATETRDPVEEPAAIAPPVIRIE